jgi:phosphatidylglycerophosphatase A
MPAIKESSDELNPDVAAPAKQVEPRKRRTPIDYLALAVATCGVGYLPFAPGTLGALVGAGLYVTVWTWINQIFAARALRIGGNLLDFYTPQVTFMFVIVFAVTMLGIWAASRTERAMQKKDPSIVVIDEVAGQMIALLSWPFLAHSGWTLISAFVLFRVFDIWKPYPIRRLEGLESGLGIMADDVLAGVYALIANSILITGYLFYLALR